MWDLLKQSDIEQAKQDVKVRRDEILKRHAEELKALDADEGEIETLDRLAEAFARKFKQAPEATPEPAPEAAEARAKNGNASDKPAPEARVMRHKESPEPDHPGATNFDKFTRALSKSTF